MSWRDLLNPDHIMKRAFRWLLIMLALIVAFPLAVQLIERVPLLGEMLAVSLVAAAVYGLRNRRSPASSRARAICRAERTPIMPIAEDDQ